ncbi:MAG: sodium/proline symporter [Bacteroidetes bacterium]|nr:sodium/proline symporter [Bacteroidota bacterium]
MTTLYVVLFAYFLTLFGIGFFASRRIKTLGDYFVGGKRLGYWVVAFSARATGESAWLLLGLTGLGAMVGLSGLWVVAGEVLGVGFAWFYMAKPFKRESDAFDSITIPDYLVSKFDDGTEDGARMTRLVRILSAGALAIFVTIYVSAQIDATGKAFESFLSWDYYTGILIGFGVVVVYTFSGGFVAVAWSDLFQGSLMLLGLVAVPLFAFISIPDGQSLLEGLRSIDPGLVNLWGLGGFSLENVLLIVSYAAIGIGFLGSPQVFVRFMSIRGEGEINKGRWVAIVFTLLTDLGAVFTGILGRYLLVGPGRDPEAVLSGAAESVLPMLVEHLFPAVIVGIYIAAVLAAIMSTIDSLLVVASSAVTRDFYQQIYHPTLSNESLTRRSRIVTLAMAVAALALALTVSFLSPDRTIFWFVIFGWSGIAATFVPVMLLSLFWKGYTVRGVIASMITGFFSIPLFKFAIPAIPEIGIYFELMGEMAPSVICALAAGVVFSRSKT